MGLVEVHFFGCWEFLSRSSFFSRCSGIIKLRPEACGA
jgi:hypothetical protein